MGFSSGFAVKVGKDDPGPQRMRAWSPVDADDTACGIVKATEREDVYKVVFE